MPIQKLIPKMYFSCICCICRQKHDKNCFWVYLVDFLDFFGFWGVFFRVFTFIFLFLKILKTFLELASKFIKGQNSERNPFLNYFIDFFGWKKILMERRWRRRRRCRRRRRRRKVFSYWLDTPMLCTFLEAKHVFFM